MKKLSILLAIIALPLLSRAAGDTIRIEAETLEPVHYEQFGEWCFEFNSATAIDGLNYKVQFQYASDEVTGTFTKENGLVSGIYNNLCEHIIPDHSGIFLCKQGRKAGKEGASADDSVNDCSYDCTCNNSTAFLSGDRTGYAVCF